jgi:hypothetical protein
VLSKERETEIRTECTEGSPDMSGYAVSCVHDLLDEIDRLRALRASLAATPSRQIYMLVQDAIDEGIEQNGVPNAKHPSKDDLLEHLAYLEAPYPVL